MKVFSALVILGFPLALILAWAFELTPEGVKRDTEVDRTESIRHQTGRRLDFILIDQRYDEGMAQLEIYLEEKGSMPHSYLRELVAGARDPKTGQAYLDRRIPEIVASVPEEKLTLRS
jgi:hypothetical protein